MTAGLFATNCPECGGELTPDDLGLTNACAPCQRAYLNRFGHLIPVEFHQSEPVSAVQPVPHG